jgi:hypothetical protein
VLIVSALLVALLLLSTALYVLEVGRDTPTVTMDTEDDSAEYLQAARNTLISALANVTAGGDPAVLTADLTELNAVVTAHSYQALTTINYTPQNGDDYTDGFWLAWGTNGGVSGVCVHFTFVSQSPQAASNSVCTLNVTSALTVTGNMTPLNETANQVALTLHVTNEGKPALAQGFTFQYQDGENWTQVESANIVSNGDGSYTASFAAQTAEPTSQLSVSVLCVDRRGISIGANLTCDTQ